MWDQKPGLNVSANKGSERISASGSSHPSIQDKKVFESAESDSGFLSGPQILYSSESIDEPIDSHKDAAVVPDVVNFDSGAIADIDDEQENNTKDRKQDPMIFKGGVDFGLSERFCELNLKNSSSLINNLDQSGKRIKPSLPSKFSTDKSFWEICYTQDEDGDTKLHIAILGKYIQASWAIIRLAPIPAVLDFRNDDAHTALHLAVLTSQPDIVRCLLLAGANATLPDKDGNSPLHLACMNSDKACVAALTLPITHEDLKRYCHFSDRIPQVIPPSLEQRNYRGQYCVHIAAQRNAIDILRHLVWLGADINAREGLSGYTALHFACENGNEQLAQFLLSECAKLNVETCTYGLLTAYQLAAERNHRNLMGNLESYGAELLSPPESDDDSYYDSSEEDYGSDDCELNSM